MPPADTPTVPACLTGPDGLRLGLRAPAGLIRTGNAPACHATTRVNDFTWRCDRVALHDCRHFASTGADADIVHLWPIARAS